MTYPKFSPWDSFAKEYDQKVYSITRTKPKRDRIIREVNDGEKVLIVGCGSATYLQQHLLQEYPSLTIYACDFSEGMLTEAQYTFAASINISH